MRVRWTTEERGQLIAVCARSMCAKESFSLRDSLNRAIAAKKEWLRRKELHLRPPDYESGALLLRHPAIKVPSVCAFPSRYMGAYHSKEA